MECGSSSNFGKLFARRHTLTAHYQNQESILTSSLPSQVLRSELRARRSSSSMKESLVEDEFMEDMEENESFLNQSFSGGSSLLKSARQRSASLHTNQLAATSGLRRTFLTMSGRGRPSSASKSRSRSGSMSSEHQEMINKVEATFATVKNQLTELSNEDTMLQERTKKLSSEIAAMQRYVASLNTAKQVSGMACVTFPIVSGKHALAPPLSRDSWEDTDGTKSVDEDSVFLHPRHLSLQDNSYCSDGSLGSCSGSLADSEGSISSQSGPQSACSVVVTDHDRGTSVTTPTGSLTRLLKSVTGYEDDVFFS